MSPDAGRFEPGALFEWATDFDDVRVGFLAEVAVDGPNLHLRDVAVYPIGMEQATVGPVALLRVLRQELMPLARAAGFERLRLTGTRLSGARPRRNLDITINLIRDPR